MTENLKFAVGQYVTIRFGRRATQSAHVEAYTSTGRVKVRAFNGVRNAWMPNLRTIAPGEIIRQISSIGLPPLSQRITKRHR